jgi:DNA adenine methylase
MQALIKWPGGKSGEITYIKDLIPKFERYIEPFFGGGAVFFSIQPENAIINDVCKEIIDFYRFIKNEYSRAEFKKELYGYVNNWEKIPKYLSLFENKFFNLYLKYKQGAIVAEKLKITVDNEIRHEIKEFNGLFNNEFCLDDENLMRQIIANLFSKIKRIRDIEKDRGEIPLEDLHKNIETAFRSGFYMHFRDVMNHDGTKYRVSHAKKIANYYFVREFCYGSMFRFNSEGHFNIPYGGIAYNSKDFKSKVDYIFSEAVGRVFKNTVIKNEDFETIFNSFKLGKNDFVFLDPPYDTDFNDYEKMAFEKKDQVRLANCLQKIKAKFMLIIKKTPFIYSLYNNKKGIRLDSFEKKYLYNVKGRNVREVEHLIIYNY